VFAATLRSLPTTLVQAYRSNSSTWLKIGYRAGLLQHRIINVHATEPWHSRRWRVHYGDWIEYVQVGIFTPKLEYLAVYGHASMGS